MKKAVALTLAGVCLLCSVLFFPKAAVGHDVNECYDDWSTCRQRALDMDEPWWRVMLALTVCDIGLGKCVLMM